MKQDIQDKEEYFGMVFPDRSKDLILGEKSVSYIEDQKALERVLKLFPDARLLIFLREPVQRTLSNYFFTVNHGLETRSLEEVFVHGSKEPPKPKTLSVNPFDYLKRSLYAREIQRVLEVFPFEKLEVLFLEEFIDQPLAVGRRLLDFLGSKDQPKHLDTGKMENRSIRDEVPVHIIDHLRSYFENPNKDLETLLGRKTPWQKT